MAKSKAEKRQDFIDASTPFLAQKHGASLSEIADHIGVGRATLQRYFPKREDLLRAIAVESVRKMDEATEPLYGIEQSANDGLLAMFELLIPLGDSYHFLATYPDLLRFEEVAEAYDRQLSDTKEYVQYLKKEGLIALDVPDAWAVIMIDLLVWGSWKGVQDGSIARNDAASLAYRSLIQGLQKLNS